MADGCGESFNANKTVRLIDLTFTVHGTIGAIQTTLTPDEAKTQIYHPLAAAAALTEQVVNGVEGGWGAQGQYKVPAKGFAVQLWSRPAAFRTPTRTSMRSWPPGGGRSGPRPHRAELEG